MSKVSKILVSLSFAFIVAFSFMFANLQPLFARADSISNYNVSFIAPDNSLLYSTGNYVPSGSSLQDIENNNLALNSCFTELDSNYSSGFKYWSRVRTQSTFSQPASGVGVNVSSGIKSGGIMLQYTTSQSPQFLNQTVTLTFKVSNLVGKVTGWVRNDSWASFGTVSASSDGVYSVTATVSSLGSNGRFVLYFSSDSSTIEDNTYTLEWVKCEIGSTFTGYYNSNLISTLLSAYNFSNYYYQYDINTSSAITSDKYYYPLKFTKQYDTWINKNWNGLNSFFGSSIWTDGTNYYYSSDYQQYVLDISTSTWILKDWNVLIKGKYVWTDGTNYYYSYNNSQYVLDTSTSTWIQKTWNLEEFDGDKIWTDGTNYYYSLGSSTQYVLNISTSTWTQKTWNGYSAFSGDMIWSDGFNIYCSYGSNQYVLNKSTSTWTQKIWNGYSSFYGYYVWSDGVNYYLSNYNNQYVLNVTTSTWTQKTWNGLTSFSSTYIWDTPVGIFYSNGNQQYVLGSSLVPLDSDYYYQNGYSDGYNTGYTGGYDIGYNKGYYVGVENAGNYTFFSLISAVMDAPLKVFYGLFNFELMGVNLAGFIQALLSLAILLFIIRFALQK